MTQNEAINLLKAQKLAFPLTFKLNTAQEIIEAAAIWATMLDDYSGKDVMTALKIFIRTENKGFPPTIGQINAILTKEKSKTELGEIEAWAIVRKAISHALYDSERYFNDFPKVIKDAVGTPSVLKGWAQMDMSAVDSVVSSNFMRTYRAKLKNAEFESKLPDSFKNQLGFDPEKICKQLT